MMDLKEIRWANKFPRAHAARRDEATDRRPAADPVKRLAAQAFHGARVKARQQQNRASVR